MTQLRESVRIITSTGEVEGHLFVGLEGLPWMQLDNDRASYFWPGHFPASWTFSSPTCGELYMAWREIEGIQQRLRDAQREAEQETDHAND